jgi:hypothetical protein
MSRDVFISHRHADKQIADVIRTKLLEWGLPGQTIFQSSDVRHGPQIGDPLDHQLKRALHQANLVLLVYTFSDRDWSYCMWECGVATDPIEENTRIVVFQCTDDAPGPFRAQVRIKVTEDDILRFTRQFHKDEDFFPGEEPFQAQTDDDILQRKSTSFYEELHDVIPPGRLKEVRRWAYLTLELDPELVKRVETMDKEEALSLINDNLVVIGGFGEAPKHFGFETLEENVKFSEYVRRWREGVGENVPTEWISAFCAGIWEAIRNVPAEPTWERFRSARAGTSWWFFPVLNNARRLPDNKMEFDFYLYRVPEPN